VIAAMAAVVLMLTGLVGAGTAQAKWRETPRIGVMGEEIWTVGSGGTCRGSMHVSLKNDARKPGRVQLTVRSKGFTRDKCRVTLKFVFHNTRAPFNHERFFRVEGTKKRGTVLAKKDYWIGSGFDLVSTTSNASRARESRITSPSPDPTDN